MKASASRVHRPLAKRAPACTGSNQENTWLLAAATQ
jgi:hypothetical protein